eukprot:CFRG3828T1
MKVSGQCSSGFDTCDIVKSSSSQRETTLMGNLKDGKASVIKTIATLTNLAIGVGMMGMPIAFAESGWLFAVPCVLVTTITSMYTGHILGRCMKEANCGVKNQGSPVRSYVELGQRAGGWFGKYMAGFGIYGTCTGTSVVFIILAEEMFSIIFGPSALDSKLWALIFVCVTIPFTAIKTLNHVAIVAYFGAFASLLIFIVVVVEDIIQASNGGTYEIDNSTMLIETQYPMNLATSATTIVFAFATHVIFPESYTQMRERSAFSRAIIISFLVATVVYLTICSVSYAVYGRYLFGYSNILSVLPPDWVTKLIAGFLLIHLLTAYLVLLNPLYRELEMKLRIDDKTHSLVWMMVLRTLLTAILWFIAIAIPFFATVMALIGATTMTIACFICPTWFYMALFWPRSINGKEILSTTDTKENMSSVNSTSSHGSERRELKKREICLCILIILVSGFVGCVSTYQSLKTIIDNVASESFFS